MSELMSPFAYFLAGFIVGGVVVGVLTPILAMWRWGGEPDETEVPEIIYFEDLGNYRISPEDDARVRADNANNPTSETSQQWGSEEG